jgi:hypothetical protein
VERALSVLDGVVRPIRSGTAEEILHAPGNRRVTRRGAREVARRAT